MQARSGHLLSVVTAQGRELSGFHAPADVPDAPTLLYVHGLSGAFDTAFVHALLAEPAAAGLNVLLTSNSGRANLTIAREHPADGPPRYARSGSARERFTDCEAEIAAWVALARERAGGPVVLWGHSLGASKVVHYLAQTQDARVGAAVLASPADVTGAFLQAVGAERLAGWLADARHLVEAGRGEALMPEDCVIGLLGHRLSAATLLDRFGPDSAADAFDFFGRGASQPFRALAAVRVPLLVLYGDRGELVGGGGIEAAVTCLRAEARACPAFTAEVVPGDHWYTGAEPEAMRHIARWALEAGRG